MKIAKHPSIWHQDYRWTISLNRSEALHSKKSNQTVKKQHFKRSVERISESEEEDEETTNAQNAKLLHQYTHLNEPTQKRFKDDDISTNDTSNVDDKPTDLLTSPKRNPFKKTIQSNDDYYASPTRITSENKSLIKNQSPVKQIDYKKLEKLSRFSRTNASSNQQILSRFFTAESSNENHSPNETKISFAKSTLKSTDNDPEGNSPNLYYNQSFESTESSPSGKSNSKCSEESEPVNPFSILNHYLFSQKQRMSSDDSAVSSSQTTSSTVTSNSDFSTDSALIAHEEMQIKYLARDTDEVQQMDCSQSDTENKTDCDTNKLEIVVSDDEIDLKTKNTANISTSNKNDKVKKVSVVSSLYISLILCS